MFNYHIPAVGLTAGLLVQSSLADQSSLGNFSAVGDGLSKVSKREWLSTLAHPNATGSVDFEGPATDTTASSNGAFDTWQLSVNVSADVPSRDNDDEYYTGTAISLTPPDSFVKESKNGTEMIRPEADWSVCSIFITNIYDENDDFVNDDGSCKKVLGKKCFKALNDIEVFDPRDPAHGCGRVDLPEDCSDYKTHSVSQRINGSNLLTDPIMAFVSSSPHKKGNWDDYEKAVRNYIPVMLVWDVDTNDAVSVLPRSALTCFRANETTQDSKDFNADSGAFLIRPQSALISVIVASISIVLLV